MVEFRHIITGVGIGNRAGDGIDFDSEYFGSRFSDDGDDETSEILVYTKHQWQDAHNTSLLF